MRARRSACKFPRAYHTQLSCRRGSLVILSIYHYVEQRHVVRARRVVHIHDSSRRTGPFGFGPVRVQNIGVWAMKKLPFT